jgi:lipopolysaccharide transport system permease protein
MISKTNLPVEAGGFVEQTKKRSEIQPFPLFVSEPPRGWISFQLASLWEYRELFYFLVWRDLKVRYKQTILGIVWAVLQPLMTMAVFSVIFGKLGRMPSDGIPYPIFVFTALVPWQLFVKALSASGNSLVSNQQLITKVYFPRLILPVSAAFVGLVDFGLSFVILMGMMFWYGITPTAAILTLPFFILLVIMTALSMGLWLSALNVRYRDVQHTIPFLTQFWLFVTPIAYSSSIVPEKWRALYGLNPMAGVVEGFRWALLGQPRPLDSSLIFSVVAVILLFVGSLIFFKRMEQTFADVV